MSDYDNTNRGAVWPNRKREKDTHPHWTGSANIDGTEYWVNAWKKKDDAPDKAPSISFTFKLKEARQESADLEFNDDVPF